VSAQVAQKVHSKEQILASADSGGRSLLQHSQLGLRASIEYSFFGLTTPGLEAQNHAGKTGGDQAEVGGLQTYSLDAGQHPADGETSGAIIIPLRPTVLFWWRPAIRYCLFGMNKITGYAAALRISSLFR